MALFTTEEVVNFYSAEESKGSQERSIEIPLPSEWVEEFRRVEHRFEEMQLELLEAFTDVQKESDCSKHLRQTRPWRQQEQTTPRE